MKKNFHSYSCQALPARLFAVAAPAMPTLTENADAQERRYRFAIANVVRVKCMEVYFDNNISAEILNNSDG